MFLSKTKHLSNRPPLSLWRHYFEEKIKRNCLRLYESRSLNAKTYPFWFLSDGSSYFPEDSLKVRSVSKLLEDVFLVTVFLSVRHKKQLISPGWCGSVAECSLVSQRVAGLIPGLGHKPGLLARSPVGGRVRGNHTLMFLSLSFSFSSPSKK